MTTLKDKTGTYSDFATRRKKIFGDKVLKVSGTQLLAEDRDGKHAEAEKVLREMFHKVLAAVNRKYRRLLRRLGKQ